MREASVTSLAILKVNWDKGHDYIENFVPFVAEAARRSPQDQLAVLELQNTIRDDFGLIIPQGALNTLLRRLERNGVVTRRNGNFVRNHAAIDPSFERSRADFSRQYQALLQKFVDFCSARHDVQINVAQADDALLAYLQVSCIPILAAVVDGCPIAPPQGRLEHSEYLVSAFIVFLYEKDPVGFGFLETAMKGSMLATALFLPEISQAKRKFDKLSVYLDTPILLRALGLEGGPLEAVTKELISLLYGLNVDLACFESTKDEMLMVLSAAQHGLRESRTPLRPFGVYNHLLSIGATASDVELIINNIERNLRVLRVSVRPRPPHEAQLGVNEMRLAQMMREAMPVQRVEAHTHDLDAMTAIHRLRGGVAKFNIETCGALFVTTNNTLAIVGARFSREEVSGKSVPLCVNDHTMATLAWVKNPTLSANVSRNRLIAQSYAALHPGTELWRRYLEEISKLQQKGDISDSDVDLLRLSTTAQKALVELTLGSADVFTEGTVQEVLQVARAEARKETELKLSDETVKRIAAEKLLEQQQARIEEYASKFGKTSSKLIFLVLVPLCIVGFIATLPNVWPTKGSLVIKISLVIAIGVFAVFAIGSLLHGGTVRQYLRVCEIRITQWALETLMKIFGSPKK